jgi:hypothetical protein
MTQLTYRNCYIARRMLTACYYVSHSNNLPLCFMQLPQQKSGSTEVQSDETRAPHQVGGCVRHCWLARNRYIPSCMLTVCYPDSHSNILALCFMQLPRLGFNWAVCLFTLMAVACVNAPFMFAMLWSSIMAGPELAAEHCADDPTVALAGSLPVSEKQMKKRRRRRQRRKAQHRSSIEASPELAAEHCADAPTVAPAGSLPLRHLQAASQKLLKKRNRQRRRKAQHRLAWRMMVLLLLHCMDVGLSRAHMPDATAYSTDCEEETLAKRVSLPMEQVLTPTQDAHALPSQGGNANTTSSKAELKRSKAAAKKAKARKRQM